MKHKINFTKAAISELPLPEKNKIHYYYDSQVNGLGVMIFNSGTITFFLYKRINGKPDKIKLGRFPEITIAQARKSAYSLINDISTGINPKERKKAEIGNLTAKDLFEIFLEKHAKLHKKTWDQDQYFFNRYLLSIAKKKITDINKNMVMDMHAMLAKNYGIYAANHSLVLLSTIYNKAIEWGYNVINPCLGIKKFKEKSRERFLEANELPRFFEALNTQTSEIFRDYFYISLLTGARKGNVLCMNWQDINFASKTWTIKETKNGESQIIHLSEQAMEIINRRKAQRLNDWVFPSLTSASGHVEEPKKAWKRVLEKAGIENLRIHDLRRTLGSWQAATGANSYIIGKSLGHKTQQATAVYARLNLDPVRESVNKATEAMFAAGLGK